MSRNHSSLKNVRRHVEAFYNWLRGYGFYWVKDDSPTGGYIEMKPGTCPYPLKFDWSVKACRKAGLCGCRHNDEN